MKMLAKAFSILEKITENAVLLEVEEYRHKTRKDARQIDSVWHFVSAFLDEKTVCSVKLTIMQKDNGNSSNFYMIMTVGEIKKEAFSVAKGAPDFFGESSSSENAFLTISIPEFLEKCNRKQQILLKNFPDGILSEKQKKIKEKVRIKDKEKDTEKEMAFQTQDCYDDAGTYRNEVFSIRAEDYEEDYER